MIAILGRGSSPRRQSAVAVGSAAVVTATVVVVLFAATGTSHGSTGTAAQPFVSTNVIDSAIDLTMGPAPQRASTGTLSPDQAWSAYATTAGYAEPTVPSGIAVGVGDLNEPINSSSASSQALIYAAQNELVYSYSKSGVGCFNTNPSAISSGTCTEWTFLDANTGAHVLTVYVPDSSS